jgi:hypothetical protein
LTGRCLEGAALDLDDDQGPGLTRTALSLLTLPRVVTEDAPVAITCRMSYKREVGCRTD